MFGGTFTNGSFEDPGGAPVRCIIDNSSCAVTGWTSAGGVQVYESSLQDGINAGGGTYYVSFGHLGVTGGTLTQAFDTTIGQNYLVDYLLVVQQGTGTQSAEVTALDGATVLGTQSNTFTSTDWISGAELSFTATSTSTILQITDTTVDSGCCNWGLDGVTVTAGSQPSATPEPASLVLIGGALIVAGVRRRRTY
jgi:hypothetical protein